MQPVFSKEDEAFREEVRSFYRRELPPDYYGGLFDESEAMARVNATIRKKLAAKGWLSMAWPKEYGGQEAPLSRQVVFAEETAYFRLRVRDAGSGFLGIAIMKHGTEEQKRRFLPRIARAENTFHQGFSEPNAGSDLTGLSTRARRDGDDFVISGQKIWGGNPEKSDYSALLARTDPSLPKHKGISFFIVPTSTPGLRAETFESLGGGRQQIVHYDECRVSASECLIGRVNEGWYIVATALNHERSFVEHAVNGRRILEELLAYCRSRGWSWKDHPRGVVLRHKLAQATVDIQVCRMLQYRFLWLYGSGKDPSYEASQVKAFGSEMIQRLTHVAFAVLGLYGQIARNYGDSSFAPVGGRIEHELRAAVSYTIMGGTSEIQRNVIAARGLGLPR